MISDTNLKFNYLNSSNIDYTTQTQQLLSASVTYPSVSVSDI